MQQTNAANKCSRFISIKQTANNKQIKDTNNNKQTSEKETVPFAIYSRLQRAQANRDCEKTERHQQETAGAASSTAAEPNSSSSSNNSNSSSKSSSSNSNNNTANLQTHTFLNPSPLINCMHSACIHQRGPQEGPKGGPHEGPKGAPRGPQKGVKSESRGPQRGFKRGSLGPLGAPKGTVRRPY